MKTSARGWSSDHAHLLSDVEEPRVRSRPKALGAAAALAGIVVLAAALRFPGLDRVPIGFQFDEAYNALDALRVVAGARPIFLPANAGREVAYTYLQALLVAGLGPQVWVFRLASALIGVATVPLVYLLARTVLPAAGYRLASIAAALVAVSYWHLHFSRYGIRAITLPPLMILAVVAFWKGLDQKPGFFKNQKPGFHAGFFLLAGLALGAAVYAHPAGRFIPFVLASFAAWVGWTGRRWRGVAAGLAVTGTAAAVLALPLAVYFWTNRVALLGHPGDVSILSPRVNGGNLPAALLENAVRVAGMFVWRGDEFWTHNLAGRPVFDPLTGLAFLLGLGLCLVQVARRPRHPDGAAPVLALLWLGVMLVPTLTSDQAPNFSRAIGALPAAVLVAAMGLGRAADWLSGYLASARRAGWRAAGWTVVGGVLLVSGGLTVRDYFGTFAAAPAAYYDYDQDKLDAVAYLGRAAAGDTVYLAPLWMTQASVEFAARDLGLRSFESSNTLVLPPRSAGRAALYALPAEQGPQVAALAERLGGAATRDDVSDRYGRPLLAVFRVPADQLPDGAAPTADGHFAPAVEVEARFGGQGVSGGQTAPPLELVGYSQDPDGPGQTAGITLFWRALAPMSRNYTVFVHLVDAFGERWGQVDAEPGNGSYRTSAWVPGETIVDRVVPQTNPCAPAGAYTVSVGVYELSTGERLPIQGQADGRPFAGRTALDLGQVGVIPPGLAPKGAVPQHPLDPPPGGGPMWLGYDGGPWMLRPGDSLPLTLYWQGEAAATPVDLSLVAGGHDGPGEGLAAVTLPAAAGAGAGSSYCLALRPRVPVELAGGDYRLRIVSVGSSPLDLGQVKVLARQRSFQVPSMEHSVGKELDGSARLLGYGATFDAASSTLRITLYWQAAHEMSAGYTAFVHVLDAAGKLVVQDDAPPVRGEWPTTAWLPGEVVADEHAVVVPAGTAPGTYTLIAGLYDPRTLRRLGEPAVLPDAVEVRR